MLRKVEVVGYHPDWPKMFFAEANLLKRVFGQEWIAVHHIGSTAIPGISAKPIIDLLLEVKDIEQIDGFNTAMNNIGYQAKGEFGISNRRYFSKGGNLNRSHHVHVFETGNPEIPRHLNFRDYLIHHPQAAEAYSQLKQSLAQQFPTDIESYMDGKHSWIQSIDQKAALWAQIASP